ncbi:MULTISPECIES: DUF5518 domain-containing protein [Halorubrum]|uniref:DUF5518 domain-containing protein n=1 Tax=Halorubrum hochstenium ATCC 700873 TaxID=1227481 RepID=M0FBC2_9EURY|nr:MULTISPECIES: DUF5518 domain-containing protein [Halorubrum]ELZ55924.1 hypothetical protein C467_09079 [Halorubrum hochstenium ATCC 700873]
MDTENTLLNAVVGAVASVLLSVTGIGPLLGGAVAGYLNDDGSGDTDGGLRVGALSGFIASIPIAAILLVGLVLLPLLGFFPIPLELGLAFGGVFVLGAIAVAGGVAYTVVLSALGGLLGVYLKEEL